MEVPGRVGKRLHLWMIRGEVPDAEQRVRVVGAKLPPTAVNTGTEASKALVASYTTRSCLHMQGETIQENKWKDKIAGRAVMMMSREGSNFFKTFALKNYLDPGSMRRRMHVC